MADTSRGDYPNELCSDCGEKGNVYIKHWGPCVPEETKGAFCENCWGARVDEYRAGLSPRQLGTKPRDKV